MLDVSLANGPYARSKLAPVGDEKRECLIRDGARDGACGVNLASLGDSR